MSMDKERFITIFTPTFNRAYIIEKLYNSLIRQSCNEFEWLVIDDGSTDNTKGLIQNLMKNKNNFDIRYYWQKNGGQHRALNRAIEYAKGGLLVIVDSDDYLSDSAVDTLYRWWTSLDNICDIAGVSGPMARFDGSIIGDNISFTGDFIDCFETERYKYGLNGDKVEAFFTDILRKYYPIPEFNGENSAEKAILYLKIANAGYKIRWFNEIIYYAEYRDDGMTAKKQSTWLNNFTGYTYWMRLFYKSERTPIRKLKRLCTYILISEKKKLKIKKISENMKANIFIISIAKIITEIYHKRIARRRFLWMLTDNSNKSALPFHKKKL